MMGRWGGLLGVLAVAVACGTEGQRAEGEEAPGSVARLSPPLQGEVPSEPGRHASACSRTEYRQDGSPLSRARFGADGLLREKTFFLEDGTPGARTVQQVESGRLIWRESFEATRLRSRDTWAYGPSGELLQYEVRDAQGELTSHHLFFYDAQRRLEREEMQGAQTLYTYSEQGLVRVAFRPTWDDAYLYSLRTLTYHPNGKVARDEYRSEKSERWSEFDTEGREVRSLVWNAQAMVPSSSRVEQHYDARGLLARRLTSFERGSLHTRSEETFEYDAAGRQTLVRMTGYTTYFESEPMNRVQETHRSEYDARGDLVLETRDTNEDGVPDWRRTLTRDASGNLLEERFEGPTRPTELGRIVYTYECHD